MHNTRLLAELAIETTPDEITPAASEAAQTMSLDTLGCLLAGAEQPGCREVVGLARDFAGRPDATILRHGGKVPLPQAVFANSVMTHALDLDDVYVPASLHVTSVVFPSILGAAEFTGADGRSFLDAFILAVEAACRLGRAARGHRRGQGFLPTSTEGIFGATAGVCRLFGCSIKQTVHALGIAYAQASGNRQALYDMTLTKRLQPAFAARAAIWAACLAQRGLTGPARALEGDAGFFKTYLDGNLPTEPQLTGDPDRWQIERLSVKRHPSCGATHPLVDAALRLAEQHDLQPADIERIEISWGGRSRNSMVGNMFACADQPQVRAQFSAPYCVAVALAHRSRAVTYFTDEAIRHDTRSQQLAGRVAMVPCPQTEPRPIPDDYNSYAALPHQLRVILRDGTELAADQAPVESFPPGPPSNTAVEAKFRECAAFLGWAGARTQSVIDAVQDLPKVADLTALIQTCIPTPNQ